MAFEMFFTGDPNEFLDDDPNIPSAIGLIRLGSFEENFVSSLYEWKTEDYEAHWLSSLRRLLAGSDRAVLINWYVNPTESSNLQWWALYRGDAEIIHVQNHMPWYSDFTGEFSVADASSFLHDRITISEGSKISEWDVPLSDVEAFAKVLERKSAR
jgi:hypothetical protein